jgi:CelD/BcsL family acetyltransferase involved in cellulose biosynthesis
VAPCASSSVLQGLRVSGVAPAPPVLRRRNRWRAGSTKCPRRAPVSVLLQPNRVTEASLDVEHLTVAQLAGEERAAWHALSAHGSESAPFVDEGWVTAWIQAFKPREPLLLGVWNDHQLAGLAALQRLTESWAGRRIAVIQSLTNVECTRFDFLASQGRRDVLERLWESLLNDHRCDVVRLDHLPEGSPTLETGLQVAAQLGWRWHIEQTFESPWRPLAPPPAAWDEGLARKFKSNLRNRENRLKALGDVTFEVATGSDLERALQVYYALDSGSWKSQNGSAVFQQANVKTFYDQLVARVPQQIWIPILRVRGEPAAAHFLLVRDRAMYLQKTAYSLDFAPYAPGQLLTARLIRHGLANGMDALDFLAANMTWKADWEPRIRPHYRLLLFAPSVSGRYAYWMRYGLREQAKRIPGLQKLVRAVKS